MCLYVVKLIPFAVISFLTEMEYDHTKENLEKNVFKTILICKTGYEET